MNDMYHSALKVYFSTINPFVFFLLRYMTSLFFLPSLQINLTGINLMRRLAWTEQQVMESGTKADKLKEQFESLKLEKEVLTGDKEVVEE